MYPINVLSKSIKNYQNFSSENFQFLQLGKILYIILHWHVIVMLQNEIEVTYNLTDLLAQFKYM